MKFDSVLDQQSISGKIVSLILCVWKPCYVKSGHIFSNFSLREHANESTAWHGITLSIQISYNKKNSLHMSFQSIYFQNFP